MRIKVLFVDMGNTSRTPMAEYLFNMISSDDYVCVSAGLGRSGDYASENAMKVLKELGMDINDFRSQEINEKLLSEADYIFCMEKQHLNYLYNIFPEHEKKLDTQSDSDIIDLFNSNLEKYRITADKIIKGIENKLKYI